MIKSGPVYRQMKNCEVNFRTLLVCIQYTKERSGISMVNAGRQIEIDIAKGIAIICMVLVHTTEYFYNGESSLANSVIEFLGSPPAAPVFMLALGVGIVYSRNSSPEKLALRGCKMFILSYVYNFFVYAFPHLIRFFSDEKKEHLSVAFEEFSNVDILQFASLAFLTFALAKKLNWKAPHLISYGIVVTLAGEAITNGVSFEDSSFVYVVGLLVGSSEVSFFPYCSWIIFPIAGYIFGNVLMECEDKKKLYTNIAMICIPGYIAMMINSFVMKIDFGQITGEYQTSYYHMGIYGDVCMLFFAFGWLSICYLISSAIPDMVIEKLKELSKNITKIYVIQYVLIIYAYVFIANEESELNLAFTLFASAMVFIISSKIAGLRPVIPALKIRKVDSNRAI